MPPTIYSCMHRACGHPCLHPRLSPHIERTSRLVRRRRRWRFRAHSTTQDLIIPSQHCLSSRTSIPRRRSPLNDNTINSNNNNPIVTLTILIALILHLPMCAHLPLCTPLSITLMPLCTAPYSTPVLPQTENRAQAKSEDRHGVPPCKKNNKATGIGEMQHPSPNIQTKSNMQQTKHNNATKRNIYKHRNSSPCFNRQRTKHMATNAAPVYHRPPPFYIKGIPISLNDFIAL